MTDQEERELQDEDSWDFEHAEVRTPTKAPRAIVSVAFSRNDYEQVVMLARRSGKKISEFIRDAALAQTSSSSAISHVRWRGNGVVLATETLDSISCVRSEYDEEHNFIQKKP